MKPSYHEKRNKFYQGLDSFWHDLYGEEYALYDVAELDLKEVDKIRKASERIGSIFFKVANLLRQVPDETLIDMGFPKETLSYLKLKTITAETVISRLDLVPYQGFYKCLEINSDTPTFIKETFYVNEHICREFELTSPNKGFEKRLSNAVREAIVQSANWMEKSNPYIVFTAHDDNVEDKNTVLYLKELANLQAAFVPLHKLQINRNEGLFDEEGRKIDILYRQTFPIESLIHDQDEKGNKIGQWLLELVELKKLAVINPPSAFLLQNKAVQAVIWGLHEENNSFFTDEEHQWIHDYFLPTYLEPDFFLLKSLPFVKKPAFGREGDTVEIYNRDGQLSIEDQHKSYSEYISVFQQFVELPKIQFQSVRGLLEGHQLTGSFLINGKAGSIGFRVGNIITDNLSYFLPVGIKSNT